MNATPPKPYGFAILLAGLLSMDVTIAAELKVTVVSKDPAVASEAVVYAVPKKNSDASPTIGTGIVDQVKKEFVPLVSVVRTGTRVSFPNSDNIRHQVYSFSQAKTFTLKLYSGRPSAPVIFDKPGVVTLGCNIHDRMISWLLVVDTPWYALTDTTGNVTLRDLPLGDYDLFVWHPSMQTIPAAETLHLDANERVAKSIRIDALSIAALRRQVAEQGGAP